MPPIRDKDVDVLGATVAVDSDDLGAAATIASSRTPAASAERSRFPGSEGEIDLKPFGPYTRVEPLHDQGSMGFVAKGYNQPFDRWELLKFLRADHALDPSRVRDLCGWSGEKQPRRHRMRAPEDRPWGRLRRLCFCDLCGFCGSSGGNRTGRQLAGALYFVPNRRQTAPNKASSQ